MVRLQLALVIEDEPELLRLFSTVVRQTVPNVQLLSAAGGAAGIQVLKENTPDLLMLDLAMPHVSGNEVLEYVRGEPRLSRMVILVITAVASRLRDDLRPMVAEIILKPITPADLAAVLLRYFE